jgi:Ser/Thr protein kinase RdoA (MazF antagonist)
MTAESPLLPTDRELAMFGFANSTELGGGQQSRLLAVDSDTVHLVVKLSRQDDVDRDMLERRMQMVEDLARISSSVVAPKRVRGRLVNETSGWLLTAVPHVAGRHPDPGDVADSAVMGAVLADLHVSLRELSDIHLPRVAALQAIGHTGASTGYGPDQLLHGDFNSANIVLTDDGPRIFDFDDSGYGPVEFDVANALYMVLFDSLTSDAEGLVYDRFKSAFLEGYSGRSGHPLRESTLKSMIDIRVRSLERWIGHPLEAPVGIRMAGDAWLEVLRRFVNQ